MARISALFATGAAAMILLMGCSPMGSLIAPGAAEGPAGDPTPYETETPTRDNGLSGTGWTHVTEQCGIALPHVPEEVYAGMEGTYVVITEAPDCSKVAVLIETPYVEEHRVELWNALHAAGVTEEPPYEAIGQPGGCMESWDIGEYNPDTKTIACWYQSSNVRVWFKADPVLPLSSLSYNVFPISGP